MPPKKEAPAKAPAEESGADDEERELVEKELVITYLKSRLGRCGLRDTDIGPTVSERAARHMLMPAGCACIPEHSLLRELL